MYAVFFKVEVEAGKCGVYVGGEPEKADAEGEAGEDDPAEEAKCEDEEAQFVSLHELHTG